MKNFFERQYNRILMNTGELGTFDRLLLRFLERYLYPEFGGLWIVRWARNVFYAVGMFFMLSVLMQMVSAREQLVDRNKELNAADYRIHMLLADAKNCVYREMMDSLKMSKEYLRYKMYEETGIMVPDKVPEKHLQTIFKNAADKKVPMKIYLRVIFFESSFDSTAVNTKTGAFNYMQMMPGTFDYLYKELKLHGGRTTVNNLIVGAELLRREHKYWSKRRADDNLAWEMALACYLMGDSLPKAMDVVPKAAREYVDNILYKKEI